MVITINDIIINYPDIEDDIRAWRHNITKKIGISLLGMFIFGFVGGFIIKGAFL